MFFYRFAGNDIHEQAHVIEGSIMFSYRVSGLAQHGVSRRVHSWLVALALAVLLACPQPGRLASGAEAAKLPGSPQLVPYNSAFYLGVYRGKELWQAVVNSGVFEKAKELTFVQMAAEAVKQAAADPNSFPGNLKAMLADEEGDRLQLLFIASQIHTTLEILKAVRTVTNTSYFQDGALVSHTVIEIKDIGR
jgi:hypothetical protein